MATTNVTKSTRRTTPKKPKAEKSYDIDAEMLEEFGEEPDPELVEDFRVYNESFRLLKTMNFFAMSGLGDIENDSAALQRYMLSMVHPDDRGRFKSTMARQISLDVDRLVFVMKRMTEAVADGNPTSTSSGSRRSANRTAGKELSEEN